LRFIARGWRPDHDTIADLRKTFLPEITGVLAQGLVVAHELELLKLGDVSLDGSRIHADASKSHAVSYGRLLALERRLRVEVEGLISLAEQADQGNLLRKRPSLVQVGVLIPGRAPEPFRERVVQSASTVVRADANAIRFQP
jgi:hypothetical protein